MVGWTVPDVSALHEGLNAFMVGGPGAYAGQVHEPAARDVEGIFTSVGDPAMTQYGVQADVDCAQPDVGGDPLKKVA